MGVAKRVDYDTIRIKGVLVSGPVYDLYSQNKSMGIGGIWIGVQGGVVTHFASWCQGDVGQPARPKLNTLDINTAPSNGKTVSQILKDHNWKEEEERGPIKVRLVCVRAACVCAR